MPQIGQISLSSIIMVTQQPEHHSFRQVSQITPGYRSAPKLRIVPPILTTASSGLAFKSRAIPGPHAEHFRGKLSDESLFVSIKNFLLKFIHLKPTS